MGLKNITKGFIKHIQKGYEVLKMIPEKNSAVLIYCYVIYFMIFINNSTDIIGHVRFSMYICFLVRNKIMN